MGGVKRTTLYCAAIIFELLVLSCNGSSIGPFKNIGAGVEMPRVSLGHPDGPGKLNESEALELWLSVGGVGVDTAYSYMNQKSVGEAVRASGKPRSDVFLTTKIPGCVGFEKANQYIKEDLQQLGMDYVDLLLIHFPLVTRYPPVRATDKQIIETWRALENALHNNLTRAIGVSNFNASDVGVILNAGLTTPSVNQCELSVGYHDDETVHFCLEHGITYEAYSPLGRGGDYPGCKRNDTRIEEIATAHNKSFAQVCLRWIVQQNLTLAVSSTKESHDEENLDIFDFSLSESEMEVLSSI